MVVAIEARIAMIVRDYLSGDIGSIEEAAEQLELFVDDYFMSHPRQAEDTTNWDWEQIIRDNV
jgi:hypothetical protein